MEAFEDLKASLTWGATLELTDEQRAELRGLCATIWWFCRVTVGQGFSPSGGTGIRGFTGVRSKTPYATNGLGGKKPSQLANPLAEMDKAVSKRDQFTKPLMQLDKDGPNLHPSMLRKWLIWKSKIGFSRYYRWLYKSCSVGVKFITTYIPSSYTE
jgi:hypothetical protein